MVCWCEEIDISRQMLNLQCVDINSVYPEKYIKILSFAFLFIILCSGFCLDQMVFLSLLYVGKNPSEPLPPNRWRCRQPPLQGQSEPDLEWTTMDSIATGTTTRCRKTNPTALAGLLRGCSHWHPHFLAWDDYKVFFCQNIGWKKIKEAVVNGREIPPNPFFK